MQFKKGLVSIIMLNWNGLDFTKQCLESLAKDTVYRPFEVIVVDNGSGGEEARELKRLHKAGKIGKLILNDSNNGFSGGNNQGMRVAEGEYMLLLNNDVTVKRNWLKKLVQEAGKDPGIGIIGPKIILAHSPDVCFGGGFVDSMGVSRHGYHKKRSEVEIVGGAALMFKRSLFDTIGGLDEGFNPIYFEESDFCCRARKAGFKVVFFPESEVIHFEGKAMAKAPSKRTFVIINKNRLRYVLLHFSKFGILKALLWEALRFAKSFLHLRPHWLLQVYWITLKGIPGIMQRRGMFAQGNFRA